MNTKLYAGAAAVVAIGALGVTLGMAFLGTSDDAFADCRSSAVAGGSGSIGGPFTLVNQNGETVTDAEVITKPSLLYFGYTYCPDVCPADTARNAEAVDLLLAEGYDVQPVFITVDPDRDTPEVVGEWAGYIHERLIGLTGSAEQVKAASQAYRTYYNKQDGDPEFYLVDHSTFTYLVLPETGFVEYFNREASPETMAETAACFLDAV